MAKSPSSSDASAAGLRGRAETRWREQRLGGTPSHAETDTQRLIHELEVHQIELEMQNDELQRSQVALAEMLEKLYDLFDFAPVGYLTLDQAGVIHESNLAGASILGMPRSALVNRPLRFQVATKDRRAFDEFLGQLFANRSRQTCELAFMVNSTVTCEVKLDAVASVSRKTCKVALTDLTERKRAEADRLVLSKLESTGILAGGIAHDFNNLLTALILNLDWGRMLAPVDGELASCLENAKKTAFMARGLTQQLLTFSKGGTPVFKVIALPELIRESARPALSGSQVRCDFSLAEDVWPVRADEGQIGQVVRNLVLNAREAMPEGGAIAIRAENVVRRTQEMPTLPPGGYVRVSVIDRGAGISAEVLPQIFDPYFSTKERGERKGMGLGLTICHTIVQKHGGTMTVKSQLGVGTTFDVYLPAAASQVDEATVPEAPDPVANRKILVMDDEETVREVCEQTLRGLGHDVEAVVCGRKAIDAFRAAKTEGQPFDVALLDLTIRDGVGGRAVIQALRDIDPDVKAIVMSGYPDDPVVEHYEEHGFAAALVKPFDVAKLQDVISWVVAT